MRTPSNRNHFLTRAPWYYGWTIVAVCGLILLVAFGVRLSFSVFFVALIDDFGWSRADTSLVFSITMLIFMAGSIFTGIGLDRFGVRVMFSLGGLLLALGLILSSRIDSFGQLLFSYGLLVGLGITVLGLGQQAAVIARWFQQRLGLAIGLAFAGTGIGSLVIVPFVSRLVEAYSWRTAMIVLAVFAILTIPLSLIFLRMDPAVLGLSLAEEDRAGRLASRRIASSRRPPPLPPRSWTVSQAIATPAFWLLLLAAVGTIGPIRMLTVHQLALMADAGVPLTTGAQVIGVGGMMTALTFIGAGALSDRIGRTSTYLLGGVCLLLALTIIGRLTTASPAAVIWVYAVLIGLSEGSRSSLVTAVASDLFRGPSLGMINGAVGSAFGAGAAVYPWLAGKLYDERGSYQLALWLAALTVVVAMIALHLAARRPGVTRGG